MRRLPSIVALLFAVALCGSLAIALAGELRSSVPDTSPRDSIAAAADDRARARDDRFAAQDRSFDTAFDPEMVRDRVVWSLQVGAPKTTDLAVVNATPGADLARTARACADTVRDTRVQCYVFAGTEAYEFKNITKELRATTPTAIVNLCWSVMASNQRPGGPVTVSDMRQAAATWDAQQCPDSWMGAEADR